MISARDTNKLTTTLVRLAVQLAGGVFSGKYKSKSEIPESGRFATTNSRQGQVSDLLVLGLRFPD